ncbi:MAG TPA: PstS family phosphate ABC transporter substrate-binding protein [Caulifigura sp.]|jgi:phosphate transport system substrate-binding protein|nr:PstS family phosphate ABC transporter substrate-binding protein [Caulifigura sp.]
MINRTRSPLFILALLSLASGCTVKVAAPENGGTQSSTSSGNELSGKIIIDGSSTVYPITQAMSEVFGSKHPRIQVPVGSGGTSSGFQKLIKGEVDIADASRPIAAKETEALREKGIEVVELEVALDGLSIVVNKGNDWCSALSVKQLNTLWKPDSTVHTWKDLNPDWPDSQIKLFGAGTNSGTFEYFTEAVNGKKGLSRSDYNQSEDDNQLVTGVKGDRFAMGYFGYSYFDENRDSLKVVKIAAGDDLSKAVEPTKESIENGAYTPLSRPVFIYVNKKSLARREVREFVRFYLADENQHLVAKAHCVNLNAERLKAQQKRLEEALGPGGGVASTN